VLSFDTGREREELNKPAVKSYGLSQTSVAANKIFASETYFHGT